MRQPTDLHGRATVARQRFQRRRAGFGAHRGARRHRPRSDADRRRRCGLRPHRSSPGVRFPVRGRRCRRAGPRRGAVGVRRERDGCWRPARCGARGCDCHRLQPHGPVRHQQRSPARHAWLGVLGSGVGDQLRSRGRDRERSGGQVGRGRRRRRWPLDQARQSGLGRVDAVVDVVGYFLPAADATDVQRGAGRFTAIAPVRVYDSVADHGSPGGLLAGQQTRTVSVANQIRQPAAPVMSCLRERRRSPTTSPS